MSSKSRDQNPPGKSTMSKAQSGNEGRGGQLLKPSAAATTGKLPGWVLIVSVVSGLIFLSLLLVIAIFIPHPTPFQVFVFRVVLSLSAAAFGATVPGFLQINLPLWGKGLISAGGALGLFLLIYQVNPPEIIRSQEQNNPSQTQITEQRLAGTVLDQDGNPLPGVMVSLPNFAVSCQTDSEGGFSFEVKGQKQVSVRLMAQKDGFATFRQDVTLGNTGLTFKMKRQS